METRLCYYILKKNKITSAEDETQMSEIRKVNRLNKDLRLLTNALDEELLTLYPAEGIFGLDLSDPSLDSAIFTVAYVDKKAVGCGAIKRLDENAVELKRFYVMPEYRKRGVASEILKYLQNEAAALGYELIKLETGPKQPEAIGLYKKFGYCEIELFGEYNRSEYSVCFEKII